MGSRAISRPAVFAGPAGDETYRTGYGARPGGFALDSPAVHNLEMPAIATSLAPMLSLRNGKRALEFYKSAFGAVEISCIEAPDGAIVARLSIDGGEFWIADESPEYGNFSPETLNGGTVRMVLTVDNPDALFDRAVAAGATVVSPVEDHSYGWRVGRIADPFGHHWEIGKPL